MKIPSVQIWSAVIMVFGAAVCAFSYPSNITAALFAIAGAFQSLGAEDIRRRNEKD